MAVVSGKRRAILELLSSYGELSAADFPKLEPDLIRNTIYVSLVRLEEEGWLTSRVEKVPGERTRPRRFYKLTSLGESALELARNADRVAAGLTPVVVPSSPTGGSTG